MKIVLLPRGQINLGSVCASFQCYKCLRLEQQSAYPAESILIPVAMVFFTYLLY